MVASSHSVTTMAVGVSILQIYSNLYLIQLYISNHMNRFNKFSVLHASFFGIVLLVLSGCATPHNVAYFQDMPIEQEVTITRPEPVKLHEGDEISILVSTRDAALSSLFSKYSNYNASSLTGGGIGTRSSSYIIDSEGFIDFPVLGKLKVEGLTRSELELYIKKSLEEKNLAKEPIITVEFSNLFVTMIGSAGSVGRIEIDRDNFTLLDAIAQSGDIQIGGMRENIKVIRTTDFDKRIAYEVNLCSAEDLYNSPVYYLQQNDVIYVEPTNKAKRATTEYGSQLVNYAFWFSLITSTFSIIALFKN